jgi:hypothetical protein
MAGSAQCRISAQGRKIFIGWLIFMENITQLILLLPSEEKSTGGGPGWAVVRIVRIACFRR